MKAIEKCLEEQIYLIQHLGDVNLLGKKRKIRKSHLKILYQLVFYTKNVLQGRWENISPSLEKIAEHTDLHRSTVSEFLNSHTFKIFGDITPRYKQSNVYTLKKWVFDLFVAFERMGMMKGFKEDFDSWFKTFQKRLNGSFIPLARKGYTLEEVVNKLSTKRRVKTDARTPLKTDTTTSYRESTLIGSKKNLEIPPHLSRIIELDRDLGVRFSISEGDRVGLFRRFKIPVLEKACRERELWEKRGLQAHSPIATFLGCIKKTGGLNARR